MASRPIGSAPPPFYWKVPVPEKDYMSENYRRIRQIANQAQKKRSEPLKAAFIPGVTKNDKYAHVSSKIGNLIKPKKSTEGFQVQSNHSRQELQRLSSSSNQSPNRRLSKSSTDLRIRQPAAQLKSAIDKTSNIGLNGHPGHGSINALPLTERRRRMSEEAFSPSQESVYNWRFKDDIVNECVPGARICNGLPNPKIPAQYCHRVEYLPCDGICAEENFVLEERQPESARSSSSSRTSRGCNTEETRILGDPTKNYELERPIERAFDDNSIGKNASPASVMPKSKSVFTLPPQDPRRGQANDNDSGWVQSKSKVNVGNDLNTKLSSMRISEALNYDNQRAKPSLSSTSLKSAKAQSIQNGGGGDYRHAPGTVPKYLKQRQEEWKAQELEKKEAEMNSNVPHGYVLLSDEERMEHLRTFKMNYDSLINDLNRIPIRIDTIRVREHKVQLEQQLTRLEEAMKTFSRPRVWVKVDG